MPLKLIADSGSTKTEWCLLGGSKRKRSSRRASAPYFLTGLQVIDILRQELLPKLGKQEPDEIYFYGTGCSNPENVSLVRHALKTSSHLPKYR